MSLNFGTNTDRTIQVEDRSFQVTVSHKKTPWITSDGTSQGEIANEARRNMLRNFQSGTLNFRLADSDDLIVPTLNQTLFLDLLTKPNEFVLQGFTALVDGMVVEVRGSRVEGGSIFAANWVSIEMPPPPKLWITVRFSLS